MASPYGMSQPHYSQYADTGTRVNSFVGWPCDSGQSPVDLANAGFFYTGNEDCTRCFYCGGGLRNWLPGDQPSVEHARWFPDCQYIRSAEGDNFVDNDHTSFPRHSQVGDEQVDVPNSSEAEQVVGYEQMVQRVMLRPHVKTLKILGFSPSLIHDAVLKVLSENGWDEPLVTMECLLNACLDIQEAEDNYSSSDEEDFVPRTLLHGAQPDPPIDEEMAAQISHENDQMKEKLKCKICLDKEVAMVFLPCCHLVACMDCYMIVTHCPFCRTKIKAWANVLFG